MIDYFESNYIDGAQPARFPMKIWNLFKRVSQDLPRGSCAQESWHGVFAQRLASHPSTSRLLQAMREEQQLTEFNLSQNEKGPKRRKAEREKDILIKQATESYKRANVLAYLKKIAEIMKKASNS